MFKSRPSTTNWLHLALAVWVILLPVLASEPPPLEQSVEHACSSHGACALEVPGNCLGTTPCERANEPCRGRTPTCPQSRTVCPFSPLTEQPMFAATVASVDNVTLSWELLACCDETARTFNAKPPVPPPQSC